MEDTTNSVLKAVAGSLSDEELATGMVFPDLSRIRDVSKQVAKAVIREAVKGGNSRLGKNIKVRCNFLHNYF